MTHKDITGFDHKKSVDEYKKGKRLFTLPKGTHVCIRRGLRISPNCISFVKNGKEQEDYKSINMTLYQDEEVLPVWVQYMPKKKIISFEPANLENFLERESIKTTYYGRLIEDIEIRDIQ